VLNDVAIEIADEVVNDLNAQLFSVQFTAERQYSPKLELERGGGPLVLVATRDVSNELIARNRVQEQWGIDVGVMAKVRDKTPESCDPWLALVIEIRDRYSNYRTLGGRGVSFEPGAEPLYDRDWLEQKLQFASVIQITFTIQRDIDG